MYVCVCVCVHGLALVRRHARFFLFLVHNLTHSHTYLHTFTHAHIHPDFASQVPGATRIGHCRATGPKSVADLSWFLAGQIPPARRKHLSCLSDILALCPWASVGITATTQLPARRRAPLRLLKALLPSRQ